MYKFWRMAAPNWSLSEDGIMLFQPGSCADPYRAYGGVAQRPLATVLDAYLEWITENEVQLP